MGTWDRAACSAPMKWIMPSSLFCKRCMSFVPHVFMPVLQPDMRMRIKSICTHCDLAGARIGYQATMAEGSEAGFERGPRAAE
jgi:hypothetical protein